MKLHHSSQNSAPHIDWRNIANTTLEAISDGSYTLNNIIYDLRHKCELSKTGTRYFPPDSPLTQWYIHGPPLNDQSVEISMMEISTLDGARFLTSTIPNPNACGDNTNPPPREKIGILNFASAKTPGGGFLSGAQAQEESIARSSTLYPSLTTPTAAQFYTMHNRDEKGGYYSNAMIYSPQIVVFRNDDGDWVEPLEVDVLTSPAVNAAVVRNTSIGGTAESRGGEVKITKIMMERMGRILYLFETMGVKNIVLGSFGTGAFKNDVPLVAAIWAGLLTSSQSRFSNSFHRVVFAILGKKTFEDFKQKFEQVKKTFQDFDKRAEDRKA